MFHVICFMLRNTKWGFTLIEMVVAVAVVALILPAIFAMVFAVLRQQSKLYALQEIKRQGDFVLNTIRVNIKNNGATIHSAEPPSDSNLLCATANTSGSGTLYFQDRFNNSFSYAIVNDSNGVPLIASSSSITPVSPLYLTNSKVRASNLSISCTRNAAFSPPILNISYELEYNTTSTRPEDIASFTYQTKMQLKSF